MLNFYYKKIKNLHNLHENAPKSLRFFNFLHIVLACLIHLEFGSNIFFYFGLVMKKLLSALLVSFLLFSCQANDKTAKPADAANKDTAPKASASYAFGFAIGNSIKDTNVTIDYADFLNGMKDVLDKKTTKVTMEEAQVIIQNAITEATAKKSEANIAKEKEFLAANGKKANVKTTATGLQYEVLKEGTGASPKATDTVKVHYVGTLLDGTEFDSSVKRNEPVTFPLNGVIPGWTEGLQLMKVGGKTKFYIPSALGYGANGAGGMIGPNSTLVFEVELLSIEAPAK